MRDIPDRPGVLDGYAQDVPDSWSEPHTLMWRRSLLFAGSWQMRDNGRVVATVRGRSVSLQGLQAWSFDAMFLELSDSDGTVVAGGDRNAVLPTTERAVITASSAEYEMYQHLGSGLSVRKGGREVASISRRRWIPVWRIDQTEAVLPFGLVVFVMAAIVRRDKADLDMRRSGQRVAARKRTGYDIGGLGSVFVFVFWLVIAGIVFVECSSGL